MKAAIVILADPQHGSEEAAGRAFNALSAAYDFKQNQQEVELIFQGTGTRWPVLLSQPEHPFHALYETVKDKVAGVSCGCAEVFGAREAAEKAGFSVLTENAVPGTSGLPSLSRLVGEGYTVLTF